MLKKNQMITSCLFLFIMAILLLGGCTEKTASSSDVEISFIEMNDSELGGKQYTFRITNYTQRPIDALALYWEYPGLTTKANDYRFVGINEHRNIVEKLDVQEHVDFQFHISKVEGMLDNYPINLDKPSIIMNGFIGNQEVSMSVQVNELISTMSEK